MWEIFRFFLSALFIPIIMLFSARDLLSLVDFVIPGKNSLTASVIECGISIFFSCAINPLSNALRINIASIELIINSVNAPLFACLCINLDQFFAAFP